MLINELDYELPAELIAQTPVEPRDSSRLMVVDRHAGTISHLHFSDLPGILKPNDLLIANDSRVIPARVLGHKPTGGKVELLLLRKIDSLTWIGLVGGRHVSRVDIPLTAGRTLTAHVELHGGGDTWLIRFDQPIEQFLEQVGLTPLPPYIHEALKTPSRYQTVYARISGSAAAPTAGLHFTPDLISSLSQAGIHLSFVTLHVGLDTFKPITEDIVEQHRIHSEWCELPNDTAASIQRTRVQGGRIVAIGTTSTRVLESTATEVTPLSETFPTFRGFTQLYITPGYHFAVVDAMITNFHLPRSTLLALVGAFMGIELMREAYSVAIRERYRFYSFGDAMLIQ